MLTRINISIQANINQTSKSEPAVPVLKEARPTDKTHDKLQTYENLKLAALLQKLGFIKLYIIDIKLYLGVT